MKTPVHLSIGAEAIAVGVHACLPADAKLFGTYRNHALFLAVSDDTDSFFAELYGKVTGCGKGKAGSMHMSYPSKGLLATSAVVATTIPIAVGAALAGRIRGTGEMGCAFFGDGAVEEGVFWESLNFACQKRLPALFVCEDNELAIHTKRAHRRGFTSFERATTGFDCEYAEADGSDVSKVVGATQAVLAKMKATGRPGVLKFDYFRFLEHVGPNEDFKFGYRDRPADAEKRFDPVLKAEALALEAGLSRADVDSIRQEVARRIEKSVAAARKAPFGSADDLYTDVLV